MEVNIRYRMNCISQYNALTVNIRYRVNCISQYNTLTVNIRYSVNCISQYNTLTDKELINVINNSYKSKRGLRSFVESCVCHLVYIGESFEQKHAV